MPLKCKKCSRINADNSNACVYCGVSLENAEYFKPPEEITRLADHFLGKEKQKPASEKTPKAVNPSAPVTGSAAPTPEARPPLRLIRGGKSGQPAVLEPVEQKEKFWVILAPMESVGADALKLLSKRLEMDEFAVRQKLALGVPWVMRRFAEAKQAQELSKELVTAGLDIYSLFESEIRNTPRPMLALKVKLEQDGFTFEYEKEKIRIRWNDVVLIVRGKIRMELTEEARQKRTPRKLTQRGIGPVASHSWDFEVLDLYPRSGRAVRLSEKDTTFTELGQYRSPSSLRNMGWIVNQFASDPNIVIDNLYRKTAKIFKPVGVRGDNVASRLGRPQEKQMDMKYIDNSEHFDEYSTLVYLHLRKLEG